MSGPNRQGQQRRVLMIGRSESRQQITERIASAGISRQPPRPPSPRASQQEAENIIGMVGAYAKGGRDGIVAGYEHGLKEGFEKGYLKGVEAGFQLGVADTVMKLVS